MSLVSETRLTALVVESVARVLSLELPLQLYARPTRLGLPFLDAQLCLAVRVLYSQWGTLFPTVVTYTELCGMFIAPAAIRERRARSVVSWTVPGRPLQAVHRLHAAPGRHKWVTLLVVAFPALAPRVRLHAPRVMSGSLHR